MRKLITIFGLAAMTALSACGATPQAAPQPTMPTPVVATEVALPERPTPQPQPVDVNSVEFAALTNLATLLGVDSAGLQIVSQEAVEWPTSALGCPDPSLGYAQVIIPGIRFIISDGTKQYVVHSDNDGAQQILCEEGMPKVISPDPDLGAPSEPAPASDVIRDAAALSADGQRMLEVARDRLAADRQLERDQLTFVEGQFVTWSDGSLGCPDPAAIYLQVLTPGYRFVLGLGDNRFEVHTDLKDGSVVCPSVFTGPGPVPGTVTVD